MVGRLVRGLALTRAVSNREDNRAASKPPSTWSSGWQRPIGSRRCHRPSTDHRGEQPEGPINTSSDCSVGPSSAKCPSSSSPRSFEHRRIVRGPASRRQTRDCCAGAGLRGHRVGSLVRRRQAAQRASAGTTAVKRLLHHRERVTLNAACEYVSVPSQAAAVSRPEGRAISRCLILPQQRQHRSPGFRPHGRVERRPSGRPRRRPPEGEVAGIARTGSRRPMARSNRPTATR